MKWKITTSTTRFRGERLTSLPSEDPSGVSPMDLIFPDLGHRPRHNRYILDTSGRYLANLPEKKRTQWALTKEEMKNCVWLKPELVAQIEFTEWTPDGH